MRLINGNKIASEIEAKLKKSTSSSYLQKGGGRHLRGGLGVILVGQRPESHLYVSLKEKAAKRVGIYFEKHILQESKKAKKRESKEQEEKIIKTIKELNKNPKITGIIVQLPLPRYLNTNRIIRAIDPQKDADGYHPQNIKEYRRGKFPVVPPVFCAVITILKKIKVNLKNKTVALVSNSGFFPLPFESYFKKRAKKFFICRFSKIKNLREADIIITAIGKKQYLRAPLVKSGVIIIDVGIKREKNKVYGDAHPLSLKRKASWLSPVPGGIGPMTVACLLKNILLKSEI